MNYFEIKKLKSFCDGLFSKPDYREVIENINNDYDDFEVNNVRFIKADCIDSIQQDELASDTYILGCFNDYFLADILNIDMDVIKSMQNAGAYEAIGKLVISMGALESLQQEYARLDGYGHHFNRYDGNVNTVTVNNTDYYVFDNH